MSINVDTYLYVYIMYIYIYMMNAHRLRHHDCRYLFCIVSMMPLWSRPFSAFTSGLSVVSTPASHAGVSTLPMFRPQGVPPSAQGYPSFRDAKQIQKGEVVLVCGKSSSTRSTQSKLAQSPVIAFTRGLNGIMISLYDRHPFWGLGLARGPPLTSLGTQELPQSRQAL